MKTIKYILTVTIGLLMLASCQQEDILFDESMSAVGFYGSTASLSEYDANMTGKDSVVIQILVTALTDAPSCDITFEVDNEGLSNPAVEGVDFATITNKKVTVTEGWGYFPISINAIDNDEYDTNGNKTFNLKIVSNSLGYDLASESSIAITIIDDDHPLGWMLGDFMAQTDETFNGDNSYPINMSAVEGEPTKVKIYGMCGAGYGPGQIDPFFILGTVNDEQTEISIATGQEWEDWNYGSTILTAWEDDYGEGEEADILLGTIDQSGEIVITFNQKFVFLITDGGNAGLALQWALNSDDSANSPTSIWTKQ